MQTTSLLSIDVPKGMTVFDAFPFTVRQSRTSKCSVFFSVVAYGIIMYVFWASFARLVRGDYGIQRQLRVLPPTEAYEAPLIGVGMVFAPPLSNYSIEDPALFRVVASQVTFTGLKATAADKVRTPLTVSRCTIGPAGQPVKGWCPSAVATVQGEFADDVYRYQEIGIESCVTYSPSTCPKAMVNALLQGTQVQINLYYRSEVSLGEFKWGNVYMSFDPTSFQSIETMFRLTRQSKDSRFIVDRPASQTYVSFDNFYLRRTSSTGTDGTVRFFIRASKEFYEESIINHSVLVVFRETGSIWVVITFLLGVPAIIFNFFLYKRDGKTTILGAAVGSEVKRDRKGSLIVADPRHDLALAMAVAGLAPPPGACGHCGKAADPPVAFGLAPAPAPASLTSLSPHRDVSSSESFSRPPRTAFADPAPAEPPGAASASFRGVPSAKVFPISTPDDHHHFDSGSAS